MEQILNKLTLGSWVINDLAPFFNDSLDKKINKGDEPASLKNVELYKKTQFIYKKILFKDTDGSTFFFKDHPYYVELLSLLNIPSEPVTYSEDVVSRVKDSLKLIEKDQKEAFELINRWITGFLFLDNNDFLGASHPHCWGVIFFNVNSKKFEKHKLANSIIHELAHQELFLINLVDRLVNKGFDYSMIHGPLQGRDRPPIGRLHSCHALYRMIQANILNSEEYINKFKINISTFEEGELTPFSKRMLDEVYNPFLNSICHV